MADLARILALPPPRSYIPRPGGNQLRPIEDARAETAAGKNLPRGRVGETDAAEEATAQAKRFKFRVHDGRLHDGRVRDGAARNAQSSDLQRDQTRAAGNRQRLAAEAAQAQAATDTANAAAAEPKGLATFLAQVISQERLGQGLHAPQLQAADLAYRRAGGEPALDIGSFARFSLAV